MYVNSNRGRGYWIIETIQVLVESTRRRTDSKNSRGYKKSKMRNTQRRYANNEEGVSLKRRVKLSSFMKDLTMLGLD